MISSTTDASNPKKALVFIFATVALNTMGIGLILPVLPDLLTELTNAPLSEAAKWGGLISLVYAGMQFLVGPILGNLSDRFGRRPVLLISQITMALDYIIMALASSLAMLFVGRILSGIAGATIATASAYIADVSAKKDRTKNFGLIGAGFGIGFIFGPAIGGLLGEFGPRAPFYAAACLSFANFLLGYLVLPESLSAEKRRAFDCRRANPLGALLQIGKFPGVRLLLLSLFLFEVAEAVYPAIWAYYTQVSFAWGPGENGASLAAVGLGFAFVQGYLIRVVEPQFGPAWTFFMAQSANLFSFIGLALIDAGWMVYVFIPFAAFGSMTKAALTGLMANQIPDNAQGELQGLIYSVVGVSMMISPVLMTQTFAVFSAGDAPVYLPGAPFLVAGSLIALSTMVCLVALQGQARPASAKPHRQ